MKLKYYLRGLGIGIIVTTIILMICFSRQKSSVSDEEIMKRAAELGMIMPEEVGLTVENSEIESTERQTGMSNQDELKKPDQNENPDASNTDEGNQTDEPTQDVMAESDAAPQDAGEPSSEPAQDDTAQSSESAQDAAVQSGETPQDNQQGTADGGQGATEVYKLLIQHGDVCRTVCDTLAANGVIADSESFRKYLMELGYASFLSVGEYDIPYGISMEEVAEILKAGPTRKID